MRVKIRTKNHQAAQGLLQSPEQQWPNSDQSSLMISNSIKMSRTFIYNIKPLFGLFCVVKCLLFQQFRKIAKTVCFKK